MAGSATRRPSDTVSFIAGTSGRAFALVRKAPKGSPPMTNVHTLVRAGMAGLVVAAGLGVALAPGASADGPEVCGYVRYGTGGPTSTVPEVTFCDVPCDGVGTKLPPNSTPWFQVSGVVCVRGL